MDPLEPLDHSFCCEYYTFQQLNDLPNCSDNLNIFHQNIRSFEKNFDEFSVFLGNLNMSIDIVVFTETWFNNRYTCDIDGYAGYHVTRDNSRGGGVSVYVRSNLHSNYIDEKSFVSDCIECCSVQIKSSKLHNSPSLYIVGIYRSPSGSIDDFNNCISELFLNQSAGKLLMFCGDLNQDLIEPSNHCNDFINNFNSFNFYPLITVPTRVTVDSSTCLDHIWFNGFNVEQAGCLISDITDHYTTFASLKFVYSDNY